MKDLILYGAGDVAPYRDDLDSMFAKVADVIKSGDVSFCQLESVLSTRGTPAAQARLTCSSYPEVADCLKRTGFDVVSFASNHAMDWGRDAFADTLENLRRAGLPCIGAGANLEEARRPVILDRDGTKIAFLGYCTILPQDYWALSTRPGCAPIRGFTVYEQVEHDQPGTPPRIHTFPNRVDMANMISDIKAAKQQADIVVVSAHWGIHFKQAVIADYQRDYAYAAIDAGADLVLGHHAHILKGIEVYKGKVIFYSLGNFGMEEPENMTRDQIASGAKNMRTSEKFLEMQAIDPNWKHSKRSFPMDSYKTILAKCVIRDKQIAEVSYLPMDIPVGNEPEFLKPSDERFGVVNDYMRLITDEAGLNAEYQVRGDEVVITGKEA